jgi:hypothetical protein
VADQEQCPDCGGTGAVEARFPISEGYPECPVCGGTGQDGPPLLNTEPPPPAQPEPAPSTLPKEWIPNA